MFGVRARHVPVTDGELEKRLLPIPLRVALRGAVSMPSFAFLPSIVEAHEPMRIRAGHLPAEHLAIITTRKNFASQSLTFPTLH
jgi:hypothetical protein